MINHINKIINILKERFFVFEKLLLWSFKTSNRCNMASICFIFCFCLFLHLFLRFWENVTSTSDFDKITAMNRQISPLNNILFSLFKHSFKVYGDSKLLKRPISLYTARDRFNFNKNFISEAPGHKNVSFPRKRLVIRQYSKYCKLVTCCVISFCFPWN